MKNSNAGFEDMEFTSVSSILYITSNSLKNVREVEFAFKAWESSRMLDKSLQTELNFKGDRAI